MDKQCSCGCGPVAPRIEPDREEYRLEKFRPGGKLVTMPYLKYLGLNDVVGSVWVDKEVEVFEFACTAFSRHGEHPQITAGFTTLRGAVEHLVGIGLGYIAEDLREPLLADPITDP